MICRESRTLVVMQFIQFFQVGDCGDLQEIEIIFAGIAKTGDVAIEGGTPVIILADAAVEQQVVPPSERTRAFSGLRTHGAPPKGRKTDDMFRSAILPIVTLFRSCAARCLSAGAGCLSSDGLPE
ncbi:hypothetical protein WN73_07600 [Bradyrhizobium sp. CCBAU 45394]|nr:hypothetical protein [Bradyrhizobium sp. CCBAU 45394]MDA9541241.1 hypothetical protein [Bradyrhizobium sp. CCBAU 21362]